MERFNSMLFLFASEIRSLWLGNLFLLACIWLKLPTPVTLAQEGQRNRVANSVAITWPSTNDRTIDLRS